MQEGAQRGRKLKKDEIYDRRFERKKETVTRQLMEEEASRMEDIIEVLGQQLENKGLWLHPDDRQELPPPRKRYPHVRTCVCARVCVTS